MNMQLQVQAKASMPSFIPAQSALLQRKCACGGSPGVDGECAECRDKQLNLQRSATNSAIPLQVPIIVNDILRSPGQPLDTGTRAFMEPGFGHDFSHVRVHATVPQTIQTKLTMSRPGDMYEQEADQVAERVMRMPRTEIIKPPQRSIEEREALRAKGMPGSTPKVSPYVQMHAESMFGRGQFLHANERAFFEPRFGHDFSQVHIHTDAHAGKMASAIGAQAFTIGSDIAFGAGQYKPGTAEGRNLLAHELTHIVQQGRLPSNVSPMIQRRLVTFGSPSDINALLGLFGSSAGLVFNLNPVNNQIQISSELPVSPGSPSLRAELKRIINHSTQYAEVIVARGQPHVLVGAFPPPKDLIAAKVQKIDIDDILAIEAKTPGSGVALAAHEIEENFQLHKLPKVTTPIASERRTAQAHEQAIKSESAIAAELVGPGQRVAHDLVTISPTTKVFAIDYSNYFLVVTINANADVTDSRRTRKNLVSSRTISEFAFNSDDVPNAVLAAALATITNVADDVMTNRPSTVLIEGFTDSVGSVDVNRHLSQRRAEKVRVSLVAALVARGRKFSDAWKQIQVEGRGKADFVVPNDTPEHRAQNRRVVITVTRPDL